MDIPRPSRNRRRWVLILSGSSLGRRRNHFSVDGRSHQKGNPKNLAASEAAIGILRQKLTRARPIATLNDIPRPVPRLPF